MEFIIEQSEHNTNGGNWDERTIEKCLVSMYGTEPDGTILLAAFAGNPRATAIRISPELAKAIATAYIDRL